LHFETCADAGWTLGQQAASTNSWQCGTPAGNGPGGGAGVEGTMWATNLTGGYPDDEVSWVLSPPFSLVDCGGLTVSLVIDHWYDFEKVGIARYDGGMVQLSTDGGGSWSKITPMPDYDSTVSAPAALGGKVFSEAGERVWKTSTWDLGAYAGQSNLMVRFRFASDDSDYDGTPELGWYIDTVDVSGQ
jgi:hypothetical protein